jgi:putative DNA primase/helicase
MRTVDRARGCWRDILGRLGIDQRFLVNKHGPCPLCGGKDRFRWDDRDGTGSYYCNGCGPGPGLLLLRKLHGWDYPTACREVDKIIGTCAPVTPKPVEVDTARRLTQIEAVLNQATDPGIVERYLRARGLSTVPDALKGHPALFHKDTGRRFPAVVAPIIGPDGNIKSAHRIFLAGPTRYKTTMPVAATIKGGAVRLFQPTETLGLAEGIETAIAARELFGIPTWAALTANGIESFEPPPISKLMVFADNDANFAGQKASSTSRSAYPRRPAPTGSTYW